MPDAFSDESPPTQSDELHILAVLFLATMGFERWSGRSARASGVERTTVAIRSVASISSRESTLTLENGATLAEIETRLAKYFSRERTELDFEVDGRITALIEVGSERSHLERIEIFSLSNYFLAHPDHL